MNRSERKRAVRAQVYAAKGEGPCPYPPNTMEAKHWEVVWQRYWVIEAKLDEIAEAHGEFRLDRLAQEPQT